MVSVTHSLSDAEPDETRFALAAQGLDDAERVRLQDAWNFARAAYGQRLLGTGEPAFPHAVAMAVMLAGLDIDPDTRIAALLFDVPDDLGDWREAVGEGFGKAVEYLVGGLHKLAPLRLLIQANSVG